MSEYEGLNLPQLLDLMHDLVRPEPTAWFPETMGWWVVAGWLLTIGLLATGHGIALWRRNRYRREAIKLLDAIETGAGNAGPLVASVLKRTALVAYPRQQVASMHGTTWANFLSTSSGHDPAVERAAADLAVAAYRPDINGDGDALIGPARRWVEVHHG